MRKDSQQDSQQDSQRDSQEVSDATDVLKTPGQLLREQRLKLAIDAKQAVDYLKISRVKLEAIETDDYSSFSSPVYARGHLRNYARLVNIPEAEIMDCYYAFTDRCPKPPVLKEDNEPSEQSIIKCNNVQAIYWRWLYAVAAGLVLLWVVAYPFIGGDPQKQAVIRDSVTEGSVAQITDDIEASALTASTLTDSKHDNKIDSDGVDSNHTDSHHTDDTQSVQTATFGNPTVAESAPTADAIIPSPDTVTVDIENGLDTGADKVSSTTETDNTVTDDEIDQLVLRFTDDCWLEVTDAEGRILATKLHRAGDRLVLKGIAPFNIMLGNAKAAEVRLNGQTVAVTPIGSQRTLRFTVDNT